MRRFGFSDKGRVYWKKVWEVPKDHEPPEEDPVNYWPLLPDEKVTTVLSVKTFDENHYVFLATSNGFVKKTALARFARPMKKELLRHCLVMEISLSGRPLQMGIMTSCFSLIPGKQLDLMNHKNHDGDREGLRE